MVGAAKETVGEAASMIHAAELIFYRAADDVDGFARRGEKMPMEIRGRIRMDIAMVPRLCPRCGRTNLLHHRGRGRTFPQEPDPACRTQHPGRQHARLPSLRRGSRDLWARPSGHV